EVRAVLMAVGRRPVVPAGLEAAGIEVSPRGFVVTDENMKTTRAGVYAVGDCNGRMMLAHAASAQAEKIYDPSVNLDVIPSAVFTVPEVAMVGKTQDQLEADGVSFKASKSLFAANGKAQALGEPDGFVKVLYDPETRKMLGCHIIGPHAADLIHEAAIIMANGLTVDQLGLVTVHGHPTLGETLMSACRL
ncbi:MAG: FAD-dependent oxidoreductase, partial [Muribaculaceae bacterium]|nr:FAD-dependent oxidoreductase [Muribaculaceae bacterium]